MAIKVSRLLSTIGLGTLLAAITGCPSAGPMDGGGAALSITLDVIAECPEDEMARVEEFVSMAAHNNHTIISFNWDVLVEVACEGLAIDVSYGGRITEGIQMAKPHGSLNLAEIERAEFLQMQNSINIHSVSLDYEDGNTLYVRADHASDAKNRIVSPFKEKSVVEPTARKSYLSGWIGLQWQRALQMLRGADEIIVIGYSLPDTDFRPRILLQLSCWDEQHRPQFILIDPCVQQIVQKYERYLNAPIQTIAESWTTWLQSQS